MVPLHVLRALRASHGLTVPLLLPRVSLQPVDISQAVIERIKAQRRLAENPCDVSAISMLSRAQEQVKGTSVTAAKVRRVTLYLRRHGLFMSF